MNEKEFFEYFESITTDKDGFLEKALALQTAKNLKRAPAKRYNETVVARQADKLWKELVSDIYNNVRNSIKKPENRSSWTSKLEAEGVMEQLDDSISEMDLNPEE